MNASRSKPKGTGLHGRGWWRRAFPKTPAHVHANLRDFEERLAAYRGASEPARAEARAVLRRRAAEYGSSLPGAVLGAGLAALVALVSLIGTYTIFLMQSGVGAARDAQVRADALNDAGKLDEAKTSLSAALRGMDGLLNSGGELLVQIGVAVLAGIFTAWIIARDHAASQAIATAWLEAYLEVEKAHTEPPPPRRWLRR